MIVARRTTRLVSAVALAGLLLGSSPLAPGSLAASPQPAAISLAGICEYIAKAYAYVQSQPDSKLKTFLLNALLKLNAHYHCDPLL
jgi:hypothetical protein